MTPRAPAYRVETARLVLRCWRPADAPLLHEAIGESVGHLAAMPWIGAEPQTVEQRVDLLRRFRGEFDLGIDLRLGIFDREERHAFGGAGLHDRVGPRAREIGYWIRAGAVRQGLATEAVAALCRIAFDVEQVERLEIRCAPENVASAAIPRRLGFRHEATLRRSHPAADGSLRDTMIWTMLPEEFRAGPLAQLAIAAFDATGARLR